MSRLWAEPDRLILGSAALSLRRGRKSWTAPLSFQRNGSLDFEGLNTAMPLPMKKLSGKPIRLVLGSNWLRYLLLPWQANLYASKDWLALATNRLRELYGHHALSWDVQICFQGYQQPVIVVAADKSLTEGLDQLADNYRWQITATEPTFAAIVNRYRRHWRGEAWLLLVEQQHVLLAESQGGVWHRFSRLLSSADRVNRDIVLLLQQAKLLGADNPKRQIYLCCDGEIIDPALKAMGIKAIPADWLPSDSDRGQS